MERLAGDAVVRGCHVGSLAAKEATLTSAARDFPFLAGVDWYAEKLALHRREWQQRHRRPRNSAEGGGALPSADVPPAAAGKKRPAGEGVVASDQSKNRGAAAKQRDDTAVKIDFFLRNRCEGKRTRR